MDHVREAVKKLRKGIAVLGKHTSMRKQDATQAIVKRPNDAVHRAYPHSEHYRFLQIQPRVRELAKALRKDLGRPLEILDVGGRKGERAHWFPKDSQIYVLDLPGKAVGSHTIEADITASKLDINQQFDIVFSNNVFEHLKKPWVAAMHCLTLCRPGGLNMHAAPFSWRFHPVPFDCFRYTHQGLEALFLESEISAEPIDSGYDISDRRGSERRQHGFWKDGQDIPPEDHLGGWLENWEAFVAVRRTKQF